ncbi:MAG: tetratricopeptide repeat protein [Thermodesulfobacteriota bacterium]
MKRILQHKIPVFPIFVCLWVTFALVPAAFSDEKLPKAIKITASEGLTRIFTEANEASEPLSMAVDGAVYQVSGEAGDFWEIKVPEKNTSGYLPKAYALSWSAPPPPVNVGFVVGIAVFALVLVGGIVFGLLHARKGKGEQQRLDAIRDSMNKGEEYFRSGAYPEAIGEYNRYLSLQGGQVRFPDVYRRLSLCYQRTGQTRDAAKSWEKMRSLGGLKTMDDYTLGAEIMRALGQEDHAAAIFEELLAHEQDEEKKEAIHQSLFEIYRQQRNADGLVKHAIPLMGSSPDAIRIKTDTIGFLISEHRTDVAVASRSKDLIKAIGDEFLGDEIKNPEAEAVYRACIGFDPKNTKFHKMLAELYKGDGAFKKAINQLTMLSALDKDNKEHMEEAARIYVENNLVADAIAEGNPQIIKKIAQQFLGRSEVTEAAVATYEKVLEFQPNAVGVNKMLATVYLTKGQTEKYMTTLRSLIDLDPPGKKEYLVQLAQCIIDNRLMEQTIKEGNRELNVNIIKQLIKRGSHDDQAVNLFEKLIGYEPDNPQIRMALIKAYEKRGDYRNSLKHQLQLCAQKPKDPEIAAKALQTALEHNLLDQMCDEGKGVVLGMAAMAVVKGKVAGEAALRVVEKALQKDPGNAALRAYVDTHGRSQPPGAKPTAPASQRQTETVTKPIPKQARPETAVTKRPIQRTPTATTQAPKTKTPPPQKAQPRKVSPTPSQSVELSVPLAPLVFDDDEAETFVSVSEQEAMKTGITTADLFRSDSGPMAYGVRRVLFSDGWGDWCAGEETGTRKALLIRVLRRDLMEPLLFAEFVKAITELGLTMSRASILSPEERIKKPDGTHGLLYPLLPKNLAQILEIGPMPGYQTMLGLAAKIVDALAYAHNYRGRDGKIRRIFHLHLQPSQVLVSDDLSQCRLASLGFSQIYRNLTLARQPRWQDPGMNPAFMPPEFFRTRGGGTPEKSADLYSLGVLMYLMFTGTPPFDGPTTEDYKFQHSKATAAPMGLSGKDIPEWLDRLVLKCMEKEPENRWEHITDIQTILKDHTS